MALKIIFFVLHTIPWQPMLCLRSYVLMYQMYFIFPYMPPRYLNFITKKSDERTFNPFLYLFESCRQSKWFYPLNWSLVSLHGDEAQVMQAKLFEKYASKCPQISLDITSVLLISKSVWKHYNNLSFYKRFLVTQSHTKFAMLRYKFNS